MKINAYSHTSYLTNNKLYFTSKKFGDDERKQE